MKKIALLFFILASFSASAQSRNPVKSKEFPLPLFFDVVGHGVEMLPLQLQYDMQSSQGEELVLGNLKFSEATFGVDLTPATELEPRLTRLLPASSLSDLVFTLHWPENLMLDGTLEAISRTGRVLWSVNVDARAMTPWRTQVEQWREVLTKAKVSRDEISKMQLFKTQYGIRFASKANTPFWDLKEPFRFCFSHQEDPGQTRLCTSQYEVTRQKTQIQLSPSQSASAPPRVILMSEPGKLADEVDVVLDKPVQFYAELKSGMSFEFVAVPHKTNVVDMVQDHNGTYAMLTTEGENPPLATSILMNKEKSPYWVEFIGWQQTIGDFRKFWRTIVSMKDTYLMVPGTGGGAFKQRFKINRLPKEEVRPYLEFRTVKGTYIDGAPIRGRKPKNLIVSSKQNSVEISDNKEEFTWQIGAKKKDDFNVSYLSLGEGENSYQSYYEIYRGYSREISARFTGILGTEGDLTKPPHFTIMGEGAFNYWFEDIFGWTNYYTRQRWGTSLKAFQTLTDLEISGIKKPLSSYTADLKYRLTPGLWGRNETWGLIAGYQKVTFDMFDAELAGVGFFWARSMPKVFEDLLNWAPIFDFPKWVDLEFIYYVAPLESRSTLNVVGVGNWALNFHGQIMFTKNFFGEAGFGLKQYDLAQWSRDAKNRPISKGFSFTSSYGTFGFGLKF